MGRMETHKRHLGLRFPEEICRQLDLLMEDEQRKSTLMKVTATALLGGLITQECEKRGLLGVKAKKAR